MGRYRSTEKLIPQKYYHATCVYKIQLSVLLTCRILWETLTYTHSMAHKFTVLPTRLSQEKKLNGHTRTM